MNVLVVGVGSIGSRHLANLVELGCAVTAVDTSAERLAAVADKTVATFESLDDALAAGSYDAAFVCTFSNAHIEPALKCAAAGCHLFIEKPLSLDLGGTDELVAAIADRKLISMVGCNMRFHPGIAAVHEAVFRFAVDCATA